MNIERIEKRNGYHKAALKRAEALLAAIDGRLEEKQLAGRRKAHDPNHPYAAPSLDRRKKNCAQFEEALS